MSEQMEFQKTAEFELTKLTADIIQAYVSQNMMPSHEVPDFIKSTYNALSETSGLKDVNQTKGTRVSHLKILEDRDPA